MMHDESIMSKLNICMPHLVSQLTHRQGAQPAITSSCFMMSKRSICEPHLVCQLAHARRRQHRAQHVGQEHHDHQLCMRKWGLVFS